MVTLTDSLPSGLTATSLSGTGWSCALATLTCTRSDALGAGSSYPSITLTVNVSAGAPPQVTNTVTVSGGGEVDTSNNTASDPTTIAPPPTCSASAGSPPNVRQNGGAELLADIVLTCTGGAPAQEGQNLPIVTFDLSASAWGGRLLATNGPSGFTGPYPLNNWTASGSNGGAPPITPPSGPSPNATFSYGIDLGSPGPGVSPRTWTFQTTAAAAGTVSFQWRYTGFHSFFQVTALLQAFSGPTTITRFS